ncbi:hypothetical protein BDZ97DRAFT_1859050, partial [Flammula alnicola]
MTSMARPSMQVPLFHHLHRRSSCCPPAANTQEKEQSGAQAISTATTMHVATTVIHQQASHPLNAATLSRKGSSTPTRN